MENIKQLLLLSGVLLILSSGFSQRNRSYYNYQQEKEGDSTLVIFTEKISYINKKSYLYINYKDNDTILVKKSKPVSSEGLAEDLQIMREKIDKIDPTIPIKTAMTGYPIMEKIDENIASISTKKLDLKGFFSIARMNSRASMGNNGLVMADHQHKQAFNTNTAFRWRAYSYSSNSIRYVDGKYFPVTPYFARKTKGCPCNVNGHIIHVNSLPIDQAYRDKIPQIEKISWDPIYKKFYSNDLFVISKKGKNNSYLIQNEYDYKKMIKGKPVMICNGFGSGSCWRNELSALDSDYPVIWYNEEEKILYMHIPSDNYYTFRYEKRENFSQEEKAFVDTLVSRMEQFASLPIDKIVIDLRFQAEVVQTNLKKLLSSIIDKPIYIPADYYIRNTPEVIELLSQHFDPPMDNSRKREVFGTEYLLYKSTLDTILSAPSSIRYTGDIYFFVDEGISTYDLTFLAELSDQNRIKIWGTPNGRFLNTEKFSLKIPLPNTGLTIWISPCITFPKNMKDFYNAGITKRIALNNEQGKFFRWHKGHIFNFDFLKENDPYFRELLEE
ncbi:hypothetical protein LJC53_02860 [Bacteroidales bacterium OttesenSCG-928-C03]|nr:hypothetical protein [Bacteroidales bacterium OttesenSCG-928-E04]MDL2308508.1 hypothetical protein [Bacteroidales bacterium OttesenSCG-928-C03]MDL2325803.1 hypothetical protein [Bacteroidales bacterium OttesenSCG-928-A14]